MQVSKDQKIQAFVYHVLEKKSKRMYQKYTNKTISFE